MPSHIPQNKKLTSPISPLRTYRGDAEKAIKSGGESLSTMVFAEQKRKQGMKTTPLRPKDSSKNIIFLLISAFLIIIGIGIFIFVFLTPALPEAGQGGPDAAESRLIITEKQKKIVRTIFTQEGIAASVLVEINEAPLFLNQIQSILFIKSAVADPDDKSGQLLDIGRLLTLVTANMPSEFPRSLTGEYLYGIHSFKDNHPFLIVKVNSFANTFASLLRWELFMERDFITLFGLNSPRRAQQISVSRSSFKDIVVKNRDARVLQDTDGGTILIYGFADQETLIITTNKDTFGEIVKRLIQ